MGEEEIVHYGQGGDVTITGGIGGVNGAGGQISFIGSLAPPRAMSFTDNDGKLAVTVWMDGTVEYGEGYVPSTAAKAFWQAVRWYGQNLK